MKRRPEAHESAAYYHHYISLAKGDDPILALKNAHQLILDTFSNLTDEQWNFAYQTDKWTVKEMMLHIIDTERIFAYRALRIARGDKTELAGFEQNSYVPLSGAQERSAASLLAEYQSVRNSSLQLFENLPEIAWSSMGAASGSPVSVLALAFMIAGHETHHCNILKERYFTGL